MMPTVQTRRLILVLNPNSTVAVTDAMRQGCQDLRLPAAHEIVFATLEGGPSAIESQRDVESVVFPICAYFHRNPADAYVIGCFSDPGLLLAGEELKVPVLGIAESAFLAAMEHEGQFGIISINQGSIVRHKRAVGAIGATRRLAGDRALDFGVTDLLDKARSIARILETGALLRDEGGASVLILGCASMGIYRAHIEKALGVPVIDPTQAAILRAVALLADPKTGFRSDAF